ncbi:MAG: hypothetical protein K2O93_05690 [Oscillospiraceae bacterium]|nr:hypothetical protein [Oscillospiraceae bacterium]
MKTRDKLILSILAGLAAMVLYASPMWWGVVFSPIAQPLTTSEAAEESGLAWESGEAEVRLKSLELLRGLFGQRR